MAAPLPPLELSGARLGAAADRPTRVSLAELGSGEAAPVSAFVASLPHVLAADELRRLARAMVRARRDGRPVVAALGGHVVKVGLGPLLARAIQVGLVTAIALNGGAAIHDLELALQGRTSEDVAANLPDGSFGMVRETGDAWWAAVARDGEDGLGHALSIAADQAPNAGISILAAARRAGIPVTVHAAIGAETVHSHPATDPARLGVASHLDFRRLAAVVAELEGGVWLNLGSAVVLPEVFLKALNLARNVTGRPIDRFVAADLDMVRSYRASTNVIGRPVSGGGTGIQLVGHHEILVPLLLQLALEEWADGR